MPERQRKPKQSRAVATHDAIVEAAARVFAEVGLKRATTARIAAVAGVSPGSMYQYFPSKDSLIQALLDRTAARQQRMLVAKITEMGFGDPRRLVREIVTWQIEEQEANIELNRVLLHEVPRLYGFAASHAVDVEAARHLRTVLELAGDLAQPRDMDLAAILVVRACRYAVIPLLDAPLEPSRREAFIDELTDLVASYLLLPRPWRAGTS